MTKINSPETYTAMDEPFDSEQEFLEACDSFFTELYELRVKYGLRDISYGILSAVKNRKGEIEELTTSGHIGDSKLQLGLRILMLGQARAENDQREELLEKEAYKQTLAQARAVKPSMY